MHDDQVGNFAKMEMNGFKVRMQGKDCVTLTSSFKGTEKAKAVAKLIVVPLYHKIRIPFNSILKTVLKLDEMIKDSSSKVGAPADFEWDIFLSEVSDFKKEIRNSSLDGDTKHSILTQEFPKYMWRAICCISDVGKYELIFDATDIEQGKLILKTIDYNKAYSMPFVVFANSTVPEKITNLKVREIVEEIRKTPL